MKNGTIRMGQLLAATCVLLCVTQANAREITSEEAEKAARNWVLRNRSSSSTCFSQEQERPANWCQCANDNGQPLFYAVNLEGGGFVITSGDTRVAPILAFSSTGKYAVDENPPNKFLQADAKNRLRAAEMNATTGQAEMEWNDLLSNFDSIQDQNEIEDICVPPLVKSHWGQSGWWQTGNKNRDQKQVFNLNTPENAHCGCVATAIAQTMRFWQYPRSVPSNTIDDCEIWGEKRPLSMGGEEYKWGDMPLYREKVDGTNKLLSASQIKAIGKLTYDVSVALHTKYDDPVSKVSVASNYDAVKALKDTNVFQYASANVVHIDTNPTNSNANAESAKAGNAILASLDAGMPTVAGLPYDNNGHEVVVDGYGYFSGSLYVHMNFGMVEFVENISVCWYNVQNEGDAGGIYRFMNDIGYNIHTNETGDVISGRVLRDGKAVSNASVSLTTPSGVTQTTTSNANGIYSFRVHEIGTYSIDATSELLSGLLSGNCSVSIDAPSSDMEEDFSNNGTVGNRWGNDIVIKQVDPLAEAVDNTELEFSTGGDAKWFGQCEETCDGIDAACSGFLQANQSSWMRTTVEGAGKLSFRWYVPSESCGRLTFKINNGSVKDEINGTSGSWVACTCNLESGSNTLEWIFSAEGENAAGYVDQVEWQEMIVVSGQTMLPISEVDAYMTKYPKLAENHNREAFVGLESPVGKRDASGNLMHVWQDILAGTDPTDANDTFRITDIKFENGDIKLIWTEKPNRRYTQWGCKTLGGNEGWAEMNDGLQGKDYPFRKVTVDFP